VVESDLPANGWVFDCATWLLGSAGSVPCRVVPARRGVSDIALPLNDSLSLPESTASERFVPCTHARDIKKVSRTFARPLYRDVEKALQSVPQRRAHAARIIA